MKKGQGRTELSPNQQHRPGRVWRPEAKELGTLRLRVEKTYEDPNWTRRRNAASAGGIDYLDELRRALIRMRTEAPNAAAEPTTARIAVGFSGESRQPPWAWSGRATAKNIAEPKSNNQDFFISILCKKNSLGVRACQRIQAYPSTTFVYCVLFFYLRLMLGFFADRLLS